MQSKYASHVDREKRGGEGKETHRENGGILEREARKETDFSTPRLIYPNKYYLLWKKWFLGTIYGIVSSVSLKGGTKPKSLGL